MEHERLIRVEEQLKWMGPRVERIEKKVDLLLEFKWKLIGMSILGAFVATTIVEMMRK